MLGRDYAGTTANIGLRAVQPARIPNNQPNLGLVLAEGIQKYNQQKDKQAYIDALNGGNQDEINAAWANYDPQGYASYMAEQGKREYDRQMKEEERDFQRELQREKLQNAMDIALLKNGDTNAQRNVEAMINAGYSEPEAWAMYYGGNNPTLDMTSLGKKGSEKASETLGKNYATDMEEYNNMMSKLPELEETVKILNQLGRNATYTTAGKGLNLFRKEFGLEPTQSAVDRAQYIAMIDNQILPLLRDTFGAQFTEREGNTLRKTLGDADATPEEKEAQLEAFIRQKRKSIESKQRKIEAYSQPSLKQVNQIDTSDPRVQEALKNGYSLEEIQAYLGK